MTIQNGAPGQAGGDALYTRVAINLQILSGGELWAGVVVAAAERPFPRRLVVVAAVVVRVDWAAAVAPVAPRAAMAQAGSVAATL
ncbi:hypothetical protein [Tardiphaga alba]|uniref:hypothetical protein n=1 Tax=Tardiphaga alba TaxID=340268 RepID=UPI001BA699C1|nr:hypothetical protein [Tardiphaga alba]